MNMSTKLPPGETLDPERIEAANGRLDKILHGTAPLTISEAKTDTRFSDIPIVLSTEHPKRKRRSDAGKPKPKPAPAPLTVGLVAGLMERDAMELRRLLEDVLQAEKDYWAADMRRAKAGVAYNAYLERLMAHTEGA